MNEARPGIGIVQAGAVLLAVDAGIAGRGVRGAALQITIGVAVGIVLSLLLAPVMV